MSAQLRELPSVAKKKADPPPSADAARDRVDLRADPAWVARLERQARRLGMNVSAYIRQATTRQIEADEAEDPSMGND